MRPLQDLRVVAIEQYGAGPFGSSHLAHLGAEVIKIEDPATGGDVGRSIPPFQSGGDSLFFETFNCDKKSIALDLATTAGRSVFERLVEHSDAVYANVRGDVPEKLRIRHRDLAAINPRIVCVFVSGFGTDGPRRTEPGYDYVIQAMAGWMSLTGGPEEPPTKSGLSLVDFASGYAAALALVAGVHAARRDGAGMDCDIGLFDVALNLLTYPGTWHLSRGWEAERLERSAHPSLVPFQAFRGEDGAWFLVACAKEKFWRRLTDVVDRPDLAEDPRFRDFAARYANRSSLIEILDDIFVTRPTPVWLGLLTEAGVPTGPVNDLAAALADPQVEARRIIEESEHPRLGTVRRIASPVRVGDSSGSTGNAPALGEDLSDIMAELGYDKRAVTELRAKGAFGQPH